MGSSYLLKAAIFLIEVFFGLYIIALLLRHLLARVRADFYHPIPVLVVKITNPFVRPLQRYIANDNGVDWATIILLILFQVAEITLITLLTNGAIPTLTGLIVLTIAHLLKLITYIYIFIIVLQVIISWIAPDAYHPVTVLIYQLSESVLKLARRWIPPISGFDWAPFIIVIIFNLIIILVVMPLMDIGYQII